MTGAHPRQHCRTLFKQENILTVTCVYVLEILIYVRDNISTFTQRYEIHNYGTRQNSSINIPKCRLNKSVNNYEYMAIKIANKLPYNIFQLEKKVQKNNNKLVNRKSVL